MKILLFLSFPLDYYMKTWMKSHCQQYVAKSPGLVVMGGDSCSKGCGFKSQHRILDGHFSHLFVVKIVMFV